MRIIAFIVLLAISGCASNEKLSDRPAEATAQIQRWVPVGTSQADAQRIMEQHRFTCYSTNADSLYFDYRLPNSHVTPTVYQMWMVTLAIDGGKVSGVSVKTGLKGL
jgi:hypothetical protein